MYKKCTQCNEIKDEINFAFYIKKQNKRKSNCKNCDKKNRKIYYEKNKHFIVNKIVNKNRKLQQRNKQFVWDYLKKNPCIDCGEKNPIVLEFDHKDKNNKKDTICNLVSQGMSIEVISNEIKKCEVRCSNCHKIKTAKQFDFYKYIIK